MKALIWCLLFFNSVDVAFAASCTRDGSLCEGDSVGYLYPVQQGHQYFAKLKPGIVTEILIGDSSMPDGLVVRIEENGVKVKTRLQPQQYPNLPFTAPIWKRVAGPINGHYVGEQIMLPFRSLDKALILGFYKSHPFDQKSIFDYIEVKVNGESRSVPAFEVGRAVDKDGGQRLSKGMVVLAPECHSYETHGYVEDPIVTGFWETINPWKLRIQRHVQVQFKGGKQDICYDEHTHKHLGAGPNENGTRVGAGIYLDGGCTLDSQYRCIELYIVKTRLKVARVYDRGNVRVQKAPKDYVNWTDNYLEEVGERTFDGFRVGDRIIGPYARKSWGPYLPEPGVLTRVFQYNTHSGTTTDTPYVHLGVGKVRFVDGGVRLVETRTMSKGTISPLVEEAVSPKHLEARVLPYSPVRTTGEKTVPLPMK